METAYNSCPCFFNILAAAEPYTSVKITHGNGIGEVMGSEGLGDLSSSGVNGQSLCGDLGALPPDADDKVGKRQTNYNKKFDRN